MSAWFTNHVREPLRDVSGVECWFSHPEPRDRTEYERTFSPATLRFDARCCAFSFAREQFDAPLASSDPVLHVLLCNHAEFAYMEGREMGCSEIARRLGFSHVEAFYRAFKRWTGQTPLVYRQACRVASDVSLARC